jgi:hypothetical protein
MPYPVVKGKSYNFRIYFPESSGSNPTFTITDSAAATFLSGIGSPVSGLADWYVYQTTIPVSAPVSTPEDQWNITWTSGSISKVVYFDVTDPDLTDDEIYSRELTKMAIAGSDYTARMIVEANVADAEANLYDTANLIIRALGVDIDDHRLGKQMSAEIARTHFSVGEYTLVWETDIQSYFQRILVISPTFLPMLQKVRFLIDRILKNLDEPQSYTDADMYAALNGGLELINGWHPVTEYTLTNFPNALQPFLPIAGAWYALNSQFMLETDLSFSYSGQTVTLDYDRTGQIESEMGRLWDYLNEHLTRAKRSVLRGMLGVLGVTTGPIPKLGRVWVDRRTRIIDRR